MLYVTAIVAIFFFVSSLFRSISVHEIHHDPTLLLNLPVSSSSKSSFHVDQYQEISSQMNRPSPQQQQQQPNLLLHPYYHHHHPRHHQPAWSEWFPTHSAVARPYVVGQSQANTAEKTASQPTADQDTQATDHDENDDENQNDEASRIAELDELRLQRDDGYGGGQGDPAHLGGFDEYGKDTISPAVWKHMAEKYNIRTVLDVGCGRGWSTLWFLLHDIDAVCVEGSKDAIKQTVIPKLARDDAIVEHDYTLGPWWPDETVDAVWAADFVQQVSLPYQANYIASFRRAALIFVTVPRKMGWHYVEIHTMDWWKRRFEMHGFSYDKQLTESIRQIAAMQNGKNAPSPDGGTYSAGTVANDMLVGIHGYFLVNARVER